ncbi:MAG: YjbQ family protein [Dehalococcoidia bacterium]
MSPGPLNEPADPSVQSDMLAWLRQPVPESAGLWHAEGNPDAHIRATLVGASVQVAVVAGRTLLGAGRALSSRN